MALERYLTKASPIVEASVSEMCGTWSKRDHEKLLSLAERLGVKRLITVCQALTHFRSPPPIPTNFPRSCGLGS